MSIFEDLQKALEESFSYTLHDKLIFISGYLEGDSENEDLLNFVNYLLYTEKPELTFMPSLDSPKIPLSTFDYHSESLCKSCKKAHSYSDLKLNCEGCPNKPLEVQNDKVV